MTNGSELRVLSSNAIKEAYLELVPKFERASGHKVTTTWAGTQGILERLKRGETYDLLIMAANWVEELARQGKIIDGSRVDLVRSGIGIAVRAGAPKPDIGSADALKRALLAARSVAYSTGPSGVYLQGLFERLGIADAVNAKLKVAESGKPVGDIVARGEAEIGFQQVSELLPVAGIDYVGPLPADVQHISVFAGGLFTEAKAPDAATALIGFITAPDAVPVIRSKGLEPG
jgi:molybdate transport system substrate-binding protein